MTKTVDIHNHTHTCLSMYRRSIRYCCTQNIPGQGNNALNLQEQLSTLKRFSLRIWRRSGVSVLHNK